MSVAIGALLLLIDVRAMGHAFRADAVRRVTLRTREVAHLGLERRSASRACDDGVQIARSREVGPGRSQEPWLRVAVHTRRDLYMRRTPEGHVTRAHEVASSAELRAIGDEFVNRGPQRFAPDWNERRQQGCEQNDLDGQDNPAARAPPVLSGWEDWRPWRRGCSRLVVHGCVPANWKPQKILRPSNREPPCLESTLQRAWGQPEGWTLNSRSTTVRFNRKSAIENRKSLGQPKSADS